MGFRFYQYLVFEVFYFTWVAILFLLNYFDNVKYIYFTILSILNLGISIFFYILTRNEKIKFEMMKNSQSNATNQSNHSSMSNSQELQEIKDFKESILEINEPLKLNISNPIKSHRKSSECSKSPAISVIFE
eukprot:NODE_749_length_4226_cov_0.916404.p5 type:complete len:132 gc:universal NODE_749_length_4226_cov_0.916404:2172-1777(-)